MFNILDLTNKKTKRMDYPQNLQQLHEKMQNTEQCKGLNVLEHGIMVHLYYRELKSYLFEQNYTLKYEWKFPDWITKNTKIYQHDLLDDKIMKDYQIYHDCGKPFCKIVDQENKTHFPNHEIVSEQVWIQLFGKSQISDLIRKDMIYHSMKVQEFCEQLDKEPKKFFSGSQEAISLLVTAFCELHANASMFGGIDSTSFKIKYKQLNKKAIKVLDLYSI